MDQCLYAYQCICCISVFVVVVVSAAAIGGGYDQTCLPFNRSELADDGQRWSPSPSVMTIEAAAESAGRDENDATNRQEDGAARSPTEDEGQVQNYPRERQEGKAGTTLIDTENEDHNDSMNRQEDRVEQASTDVGEQARSDARGRQVDRVGQASSEIEEQAQNCGTDRQEDRVVPASTDIEEQAQNNARERREVRMQSALTDNEEQDHNDATIKKEDITWPAVPEIEVQDVGPEPPFCLFTQSANYLSKMTLSDAGITHDTFEDPKVYEALHALLAVRKSLEIPQIVELIENDWRLGEETEAKREVKSMMSCVLTEGNVSDVWKHAKKAKKYEVIEVCER